MSHAAILVLAMLLDAVVGEPDALWRRWPHPAVLMGRLIGWADKKFNTGDAARLKGILLAVTLVLAGAGTGWLLSRFGWVPEALIAVVLLAQKSLVQHVRAVGDALRVSLADGRRSVAMIVSRDTADMDQNAVARSAIESGAENLSDGVIAPAFWFLLGGLPGMIAYKLVNTADSMIGYRTPRHAAFGWASARLDDVLNWIPARLTALLLALTYQVTGQWRAIARDARMHRSPNAGWPEAAMARALNISLAGPRSYEGEMREFPYVNPNGRKTLNPDDVDAACQALWRGWAAFLAVILLLALAGCV